MVNRALPFAAAASIALSCCGEEPDVPDITYQTPVPDYERARGIVAKSHSIVTALRDRVRRIINADDAMRVVFIPLKYDTSVRVRSLDEERAFFQVRAIPGKPEETGDIGVLDYKQVGETPGGERNVTVGHGEVNWRRGQAVVDDGTMMGEAQLKDGDDIQYVAWRGWVDECLFSDKRPVPDQYPDDSKDFSLPSGECRGFQDEVFNLFVEIAGWRSKILPVLCLEWDSVDPDKTITVDCPEDISRIFESQ